LKVKKYPDPLGILEGMVPQDHRVFLELRVSREAEETLVAMEKLVNLDLEVIQV